MPTPFYLPCLLGQSPLLHGTTARLLLQQHHLMEQCPDHRLPGATRCRPHGTKHRLPRSRPRHPHLVPAVAGYEVLLQDMQ